jgi:hypothetical protein
MTSYDDITLDNDASLIFAGRPRHAHPKGQPRRSWAPADGVVSGVLPVLDVPGPVLSERQTYELLDQMDGDLFREVKRGPLPLGTAARSTAEIFEHLAPRRRPAPRGVVRSVAGFVAAVAKTTARVGLVLGLPLAALGVLYGLGA